MRVGTQTVGGLDSTANTATRRGSLALTANVTASYTIRNLLASTAYRVCFTPDGSAPPISATVTTSAATDLSLAIWQTVGSAGFSGGYVGGMSLAFSPDGTPYLAYSDGANNYNATVVRFDGTSWVTVGSAGFSAGSAYYESLAFSPDGTPYLAYSDGGNNYNATVMRFDGTSWVVVGSAGFSAGSAYYQSLAFSPDGTPYLAYGDGGNNYYATVMRFNGTSWVTVGSADFSAGGAYDESLAFSPDGTPYVAYHDGGNNYYATVMRYDGTSWVAVGAAGFSGVDAALESLAFSPNGTPFLAYQDKSNNSRATVVRFDGTSWVTVGNADFSPGTTYDESLAFSPDGTAFLAYQDANNGSKASVLRFDGTSWVTVGGGSASSGGSGYDHLAFSPDGMPYIALVDGDHNAYATVIRFASPPSATTGAATGITASSATLNGVVNGDGASAAVTFEYGTTTAYGSVVTASIPSKGTVAASTGNTAVSAVASGLQPVTEYHFRVAATAAGTTVQGGDASFTTGRVSPAVTFPTASAITYGQALSACTLTGGSATYNSATVPGSFAWTTPSVMPAAGSYPSTYTVTFTPTDTSTYNSVTHDVPVAVSQITPTITWSTPLSILYGTALSAMQLDASASVPGSFSYSPAAGAVLSAGSHTLSTTFTPADSTNYATQTASVTINFTQATPTITWSNPFTITYGVELSATQLNASASVPGSFSYSPAAGTVLSAGRHTLTTIFTPTDATDYSTQTGSATLSISQATPTITWPNPTAITYGTPLSTTQLSASASVPGSFSYSPAAGTILCGGSHTLTATFTPTDTTDYSTQTGSATLSISRATPTITWSNPTAVTYGTPLSATQLNASASVPGSFSYSPAAGTVLSAGSHALTATFTSTDTTDYATQTASVTLSVAQAAPTITVNGATLIYATASTTLSASITYPATAPPEQSVFFTVNGSSYAGTCVNSGSVRTCSSAEVPTRRLPLGSYTFGVVAAAEGNYAAGVGTGNLTVKPAPDFQFAVTGATSQTVIAGATATFQLALSSPYPSYPGPVSFSVTGLPAGAMYTITPNMVDVTGGAQAATLTITIAKPVPTQNSRSTPRHPSSFPILATLLLPPLRFRRKLYRAFTSRLGTGLLLLAGSLGAFAALSGCGAFGIAPPVNYVVNVAADSGSVQHIAAVTINVQ